MNPSGEVQYVDDYGTVFHTVWVTVGADLDVTTEIQQPYVWGQPPAGRVVGHQVWRRGIITVLRQILRPTAAGYVIVAEGASQRVGEVRGNWHCQGRPSDRFRHHLNHPLVEACAGSSADGGWSDPDAPTSSWPTDLDLGLQDASTDLQWIDVWANVGTDVGTDVTAASEEPAPPAPPPISWQAFWKFGEAATGPWLDSSGHGVTLTRTIFASYTRLNPGKIGIASRASVSNTTPAPWKSTVGPIGGGASWSLAGYLRRSAGRVAIIFNGIGGAGGLTVVRVTEGADVLRVQASANNYVEFPLALDPTTWVHVAVTFNAGAVTVYKDGVAQVQSGSLGTMPATWTADAGNFFTVGTGATIGNSGTVDLDSVGVGTGVLSAADVAALLSADPF